MRPDARTENNATGQLHEHLVALCISYIAFIHTVGDAYYRVQLHGHIERLVGTDVSEVLHNLDRHIGYDPYGKYGREDLEALGRKLAGKLGIEAQSEG